ncbi:unnamed protein product, partial [Prorocentrum cordatum]
MQKKVNEQPRKGVDEDGEQAAASWGARAREAAPDAGGRYIKQGLQNVVDGDGLCIDGAMQVVLRGWMPLWLKESRKGENHPCEWARGPRLEPIISRQVSDILKRVLMQLLAEYVDRPAEILITWEAAAKPMDLFTMVKVFLPKAEGGVRPIRLAAFCLRLWGRIRQPLVQRWEAELPDQDHFWGGVRTPCDMAGIVSNMVACHARTVGFAHAAGLLDLAMSYEHAPHEVLRQEGVRAGVPQDLLRLLCISCKMPRRAKNRETACEKLEVNGTRATECSCATGPAKVLMHRTFFLRAKEYRLMRRQNVVDDAMVQEAGKAVQAMVRMAELLEAKDLVVSWQKAKFMAGDAAK